MKKSLITAKKLIKNYKWNSIFVRYFLYTFCFFILPSSIISLFFFNNYSNSLKNDARISAEHNAQKSFSSINDVVTQVTGIYSIISTDYDVASYVLSDSANLKEEKEFSHFNNINKLLKYNLQQSAIIESIDIFSLTNNYILSTKNSNYYKNYTEKEKLEPFIKNNRLFYCISSDYNNVTNFYNQLTFGYPIIFNEVPAGLIMITIDCNKMSDILATNTNETVIIYDAANRNTLFSSNSEYTHKIPENSDEIKKFPSFSTFKNGKSISYVSNILSGVNVIYTSDITHLEEANKKFVILGIILLVLSILIPLLTSLYSSYLIYNAIVKITTSIHSENEINTNNAFNEIEYISNNLLNISKKKQDIETELAKNISTLKTTQATALQMQISPHFLFNTLNVVSMIIMDTVKEENDAQKVLGLLSSFLNDILSSTKTITTLSDEIKTLNKYIEIELIKNNYDFNIIWETDEKSLSSKTVKFILQPIVENALSHGIKPVENLEGVIKIKTKVTDNQLIIQIWNNGKTIDKSKLEEIRQKLLYDDMPQNHIGLYNVNQRIKIIFGNDYGCKIDSDKDGTTVTIIQPAE